MYFPSMTRRVVDLFTPKSRIPKRRRAGSRRNTAIRLEQLETRLLLSVTGVVVHGETNTPTYGTAASNVTYDVEVDGANGDTFNLSSVTGLPSGVTPSFDNTTQTIGVSGKVDMTLTVSTTAAAQAVSNQSFTVTATDAVSLNDYSNTGSFTINQAALTVTADGKSKTYGDADPTLTYSVTGTFYNGDTSSVVSGVSLSTTTDSAATAGTHAITISGAVANNYTLAGHMVAGVLTVSQASLTVTADDQSKVYGAADQTDLALSSQYAVSGTFFYGDDASVVTGVALTTAKLGAATAGTHDITFTSPGAAANYAITDVTGTLTVTKAAALTATADHQTKTYGGTDPTLTYTVTGTRFYGDATSVVSGVSLSTDTGALATAGDHTITASGGTAANYNVVTANNTLTVSQASLTVTADAQSKVYGAADPTLTYTVTGTLFYGDLTSVVSGVAMSTATDSAATVGTHTITFDAGGTADNYAITNVTGLLTVTKAALTVTADDQSEIYGDANPTLTYTVTGDLFYGDDPSVVISGVVLTTTTGAAATAGTHTISASGGTAANYAINDVAGTLTVAQKELTVTANSYSKAYGVADPTLTYTVTGLLNGTVNGNVYTDTAAVVSGVSLSTATGANATFGTHAITATGGTAANYYITDVDGTATVNKATLSLTVTADPKSKVYGAADPSLTYSVTGTFFYTDDATVVTLVSLDTDTGAAATVGAHTITVTGGAADNYNLAPLVNGTLTVTKAALTVTADNQSKVYGDADPDLTYTLTGTLFYTDDVSVITGPSPNFDPITLTTVTDAAATAGTHAITVNALIADNYTVTSVNGVLTVSQAALTVQAENKSKIYGDVDPGLTYTVNGLKYLDAANVVTGVSLSTTTAAAATVGTHTITASGGTAANYAITDANGTLTVTKATLTLTADNKSKVFGAADPTLTYSVSGLKYTDTASVVSGASLSTTTGSAATYGTWTITASNGTATNYSVVDVNGVLTVSKATLTVTADAKSKVYGATDPTLTYTVTGMQYTDDASVVSNIFLSTTTASDATAGTHVINISGGNANNYNVNDVSGTLTVSQAALTLTADNQSKVYGDPDPTLTYTATGFQYGDDTSVIIGTVSLSTTTGSAATVGTHTITASGGTATNYAVTDANGTLTVTAAGLTVTADNKGKVYGAADPTLTYKVSGLKYGDASSVLTGVSLSTTTGSAATAGTHTITASGGTASNYTVTLYNNGLLTVAKAVLTIQADNKTKVYGATDPALTYSAVSGLQYTDDISVVSTASLSTTVDSDATVGTHQIVATGAVADNYTVTARNGTLTVTRAALTVTADSFSKTYGDPDPSLTYTVDGLQYADDASVVTGVKLTTKTGSAAKAGVWTITASGGVAANYSITDANGTLTVAQAVLTIQADDKSKVYGAADPTLTFSVVGGLLYTDTKSVVTGAVLTTLTGSAATAGTHPITFSSPGSASNYTLVENAGTLTVSQAVLTVKADNKTKVYGAADPALTYSLVGLKYSDTDSSVLGSSVVLTTDLLSAATAGAHVITHTSGHGGTATNYSIVDVDGTLTVSKAALTVTALNQTEVYGTNSADLTAHADGTPTISVVGLITAYGDDATVINGLTLSTKTGSAAKVGTFTITASGGTANNYKITDLNGTLTVTKALLTITPDDKTKVYGAADPKLTYTVQSGLVYSDTASVISGVTLTTTTGSAATVNGGVGHAITASGGVAANYTIIIDNPVLITDPGHLTVTPAALTLKFDNKTKVYGAADPSLTYTVTGLKYGDPSSVVSGVTPTTDLLAAATAGTHVISDSGTATASNYTVTEVNGTLTVSKAALTVTALPQTEVYGTDTVNLNIVAAPSASPTIAVTGLIAAYGDTASVINGLTLSTTNGSASTVGTHTIKLTGGTADNYKLTDVNGTLTVTPAALTIKADDKSKVYGAADPTLTFHVVTGLAYSDTQSVVKGAVLTTTKGSAATAGTHDITFSSPGTASNYTITAQTDTNGLTVSKASLTVAANNMSKVYGAADPTFTYSVNGLKYGDPTSVLTGVVVTPAITYLGHVGTYALTASVGTAANYAITYVGGTLTVAKARLTVTAANQAEAFNSNTVDLTVHAAPTANPTITVSGLATTNGYHDTATSVFVNGASVSLSTLIHLGTTTGSAATIGTHSIIITAVGTLDDYILILVNGKLTVS